MRPAIPGSRALVTWAAISTVERWPAPQRAAWREAGVNEVKNARTGEVLPLYTDVLDDIEHNGEPRSTSRRPLRGSPCPGSSSTAPRTRRSPLREGERLARGRAASTVRSPVEGAGHTFGAAHPWRGPTPELARVEDATLAFFAEHLG